MALNFDQMRALAAEGIPLADVSTNRKDTLSQAWLKQALTKRPELEAVAPDRTARLVWEAIERYWDHDAEGLIRDDPLQRGVLQLEVHSSLKRTTGGVSPVPLGVVAHNVAAI